MKKKIAKLFLAGVLFMLFFQNTGAQCTSCGRENNMTCLTNYSPKGDTKYCGSGDDGCTKDCCVLASSGSSGSVNTITKSFYLTQ